MTHPTIAYKILTTPQLAELLTGSFAGAPVDLADGYIHLSTAEQLPGTLEKHFAGQTGLHLAAIDLPSLGQMVKWEVSRGNALFPHVFAALPLSSVLAHAPVAHAEDGSLELPGPASGNGSPPPISTDEPNPCA